MKSMAIAIVMCALVFSRYAKWHFLNVNAAKYDDNMTMEIQAWKEEERIESGDKIGMSELNGRNY